MTTTVRLNLSAPELRPGDLIVEGLADTHELDHLQVFDADATPVPRNRVDPDSPEDGTPVVRVWNTESARETGAPEFLIVEAASGYVVERAEERLTDQQRAAFELPPRG